MAEPPAPLAAEYFDGTSARAHAVRLTCHGGQLHIDGDGIALSLPRSELRWPERTRHGLRVAQLAGGGTLNCADAPAWDAFARHCGQGESAVVRAQQSWRWVGASLLALVVLLVGAYLWGVPMVARAVVALAPPAVDRSLGETALASMDEQLMQPSHVSAARQQQLRAAFAQALAAQPAGSVPEHRIEFRHSRIGPNAFALPGGAMVVTDELVQLLDGHDDTMVGVLAHELGHLRQRHGLRMVVQAAAVGVLAGAVLGDFSTLLASAPVLLGQAGYSRDAEREADEESIAVLRGAGISPRVMVTFFDKIAERNAAQGAASPGPAASGAASAPASTPTREPSWLGIAIGSHPADEERVRRFRDAASPPR